MTVKFDPDAEQELLLASDYYEERRAGYGSRFIAAVEAATEAALATPKAGAVWPQSPPEVPIRRRRVPGFPSVWLAYVVLDDSLYVLAVVHTSRRPGYWLDRVGRLRDHEGR